MDLKELFEMRAATKARVERYTELLNEAKKELNELDSNIQAFMQEAGLNHIKVGDIRFELKEEVVPKVGDWDSFYQWIKNNDAFFLLHRRVSATAWRDLVESGEIPDGVESTRISKLRVVKA